jgi:hypothetical protein
MNAVRVRRGIEGLAGFGLSASLGLWLPVAALGLLFVHGENPQTPLLWAAIPPNIWPLIPAVLWLSVMVTSMWVGIKHWRRSAFSLGLLLGAVAAITIFTMIYLANWLAA